MMNQRLNKETTPKELKKYESMIVLMFLKFVKPEELHRRETSMAIKNSSKGESFNAI
jgi:hypothetical protein